MLNVENMTKIFNRGTVNENWAITNLSLTLNDGDFVTVIGGNGAGKTTLLNAIAGVYGIDAGSIALSGNDLTRMPEHKRAQHLGRVFQDPMMGTAAKMGIDENLALASRRGEKRTLKWCVSRKKRQSYRETVAMLGLGLEDRLTEKVGMLSGGQRQALTLLMATLKKPKLLLLDEHTAALDPSTAEKVLLLTDKLVDDNALTTLMVTHNMKDAIEHGNRLIMMNHGKIVLDISAEEKKHLTVDNLLERFARASGGAMENDRVLLSKAQ